MDVEGWLRNVDDYRVAEWLLGKREFSVDLGVESLSRSICISASPCINGVRGEPQGKLWVPLHVVGHYILGVVRDEVTSYRRRELVSLKSFWLWLLGARSGRFRVVACAASLRSGCSQFGYLAVRIGHEGYEDDFARKNI